jgi:hypothetical protein
LSGLIDRFGENLAQAFDQVSPDQRLQYWRFYLHRPSNTFSDARWKAYADSTFVSTVAFLDFIQKQNDSTYVMGERITSISDDADKTTLNLDTELAEIARYADLPIPENGSFNQSPDEILAAIHR